ncbi:lipid A 3-O-deacylase PagL [Novosphingobium kunmingense]|uniref:Lipid A 3-O-deacylase PagL n=1 Tax=Novosphingobium kunmingense TaxID=1211806 RepID=A0A2N0H7B8_9SPHN|nr:acyloxyacyl hydrolase [Novosphingobium kunmingense]PKB14827.1 lipid A 3-O-deacylase PagL [Novosphingobium kunmingense]
MPISRHLPLAAVTLALVAAPAAAQEVYLGASFHAVDLPTSLDNGEVGGHDVQFGLRSDPIEALAVIGKPSIYAHGQIGLDRTTSLGAVGLSWKLGDAIYVRPGIGLALHSDRIREFAGPQRIDLGSRVLFEPELALGARLNDRVALEASWVHVSHATLLSGQNPGMDFLGARLVYKLN